jgi:hypothetical protein
MKNKINSQFRQYVNDIKSSGHWDQDIIKSSIKVDGVDVPVYDYYAGRNASHSFSICQEIDGSRWFQVSSGPEFVSADKFTEEDMRFLEYIKDQPYFADSVILAEDGTLRGMEKDVLHVTTYDTFEQASRGYLGHW